MELKRDSAIHYSNVKGVYTAQYLSFREKGLQCVVCFDDWYNKTSRAQLKRLNKIIEMAGQLWERNCTVPSEGINSRIRS